MRSTHTMFSVTDGKVKGKVPIMWSLLRVLKSGKFAGLLSIKLVLFVKDSTVEVKLRNLCIPDRSV